MAISLTRRRRADRSNIALDTEKLRALRLSLKLTQAEVARRARLAGPHIVSAMENGERTNITLDTLDRIAAALGVKARDLLK